MRRGRGLFWPWWLTLDGEKLYRATKRELAEAYRLWVVHADVREGKP